MPESTGSNRPADNRERLPQVPGQVVLPAWINPDGFPHPEALEDIRAEAAGIEAGLVAAIAEVRGYLRRVRIIQDAVYVAVDPACADEDCEQLPGDVLATVRTATGVDHLRDLVLWSTGTDGDMVVSEAERDQTNDRFGYLDGWDDGCRAAADRLGGGNP